MCKPKIHDWPDGMVVEWVLNEYTDISEFRKELKTFGIRIYTDPTNFANIYSHILCNKKLSKKQVYAVVKALQSRQ